jgi:hypothetical protein
MKAPAMIGVAVLALATVLVSAAASGSRGARLPLPQTAFGGRQAPAGSTHSSTGSAAGTAPSTADPSNSSSDGGASQQVIYATSPPAALTGCTVWVSNSAPLRGQTAETATVSTTAGAEVRLEADYVKTRSVHDGLADGSGNADFALAISHAQPGFTVHVTATVSLRKVKFACSTSFTPVDPTGAVPTTAGGQ